MPAAKKTTKKTEPDTITIEEGIEAAEAEAAAGPSAADIAAAIELLNNAGVTVGGASNNHGDFNTRPEKSSEEMYAEALRKGRAALEQGRQN